MFPAFELFGRTISAYTIMALVGIFAAGLFAIREAGKRGLDSNDTIELLLVAGIGVLFGGHALYALTHAARFPGLFASLGQISLRDFLAGLFSLVGGSVFYGGLLGGLAAGVWHMRRKKLDRRYTDILAAAVPLFHVFGRVGCFLGGCCYGVPSRFGVIYTRALVPGANLVQRFPVALLEALFNLTLFFVIKHLLAKDRGGLFTLYLLLYALGRFFLEFLRGDAIRGAFLGFSTSQWVSFFIIIVCGLGDAGVRAFLYKKAAQKTFLVESVLGLANRFKKRW